MQLNNLGQGLRISTSLEQEIHVFQIEETPRHPDIVIFRDAWICCLKYWTSIELYYNIQ